MTYAKLLRCFVSCPILVIAIQQAKTPYRNIKNTTAVRQLSRRFALTGLKGFFSDVQEDYVANGRDWTRPGFRTLFVYRFGNWRMSVKSRLLRAPLSFIYRTLYRRCRNFYGIEIPYTAKIEPGVIIEHQGGIVMHGSTSIGKGSIVRQNCTLGIRSLDRLDEAPCVGRGVNIGAGAVLLGKITVGDGAQIGANAVVLIDVPSNGLAVGVPATIKEGTSESARSG